LSGPSLFNFAEVSRLLIEAQGLQVVNSPEQLSSEILQLLESPAKAKEMGSAAKAVAEDNRGALERLLRIIDKALQGRSQ